MTRPASMAPAVMQDLRSIRRDLADAPDAHLLQVVRVMDRLEQRGDADVVLAPVRQRLRIMHPAHPLRFARLLFLPADPLIVAPNAWRPGRSTIPRQALMALARCVQALMASGSPAAKVTLAQTEAAIEGVSTADTGVIAETGARLWPQAAAALHALATSPDRQEVIDCAAEWRALGLPQAELTATAESLSCVLGAGRWLHETAAQALTPERAVQLLTEANARGPRAGAMLLCLLLLRTPRHTAALLAAAQTIGVQRAAVTEAAELMLDQIERDVEAAPGLVSQDKLAELRRQADLLDALAEHPGDPNQRRRVLQARASVLNRALHCIEDSLHCCLMEPLRELPGDTQAADEAIHSLEDQARRLRMFGQEVRRLGGGARLDSLAAAVPQALSASNALTRMDRARLIEILVGPEAALLMLAGRHDTRPA